MCFVKTAARFTTVALLCCGLARAQAAADGIRTELPAPRVINVRGRGGPLDETAVQQAVLLAMDWPSRISQLFPDGDGKIFALIGEAAPRDLAFSSQDFIANVPAACLLMLVSELE